LVRSTTARVSRVGGNSEGNGGARALEYVIGPRLMQKTTSALLGALVLVVTIVIVVWGRPRAREAARPPEALLPEPVASVSAAADAGVGPLEALLRDRQKPVLAGQAGSRLADGTVPPPLPFNAPRSLRFGVVLVQYRGAERASPRARTRAEAEVLATELREVAQSDFKAAVARGDPGSAVDLGRIGVNILEPAPNYVLFTLGVGEVGGPVDTPTGFWIVRNLGK